jgi:hypothetical protein
VTSTSPQLREVVAEYVSRSTAPLPIDLPTAQQLAARAASDPCASSLAHVLAASARDITASDRRHHIDEAQQGAERCGDDRVLAESALAAAGYAMENEWLGETMTTKLRLAEAAVNRVEQRDLTARVERMRASVARRASNLEEAIARGTAAMEGFAARGRLRKEIEAGLALLRYRQYRATPDELGEADEIVRTLDTRVAEWRFSLGDVAGAHALLDRVRRELPNDKPRRITGSVVDMRGQPVAGATVTAGSSLMGDSVSAACDLQNRGSVRSTQSGPDGRFEIADAVDDAVVIAELGDRRSSPVAYPDNPRLVLEPTSRLEGRVDLAGEHRTKVFIAVMDLARAVLVRYSLVAPVMADGSFTLSGVPRREVRVFATVEGATGEVMGGKNIVVRDPVIRGVTLSLKRSERVLHVLVRNLVNTRLANAQVVVQPGKIASTNLLEYNRKFQAGSVHWARQLEGEHAPKQVVAVARPGDLFATITSAPEGLASACAMALPELSDADMRRKFNAQLDKIPMTCTVIPEGAELVMIEVSPLPRLD